MKAAVLILALLPFTAFAADEAITDAEKAQLEKLRGEIAGQIQLQAYDLVDELVYGWTQNPVFGVDTPVVLADVTVPVGFGSGLEALIENHFFGVVAKNPRAKISMVQCPQCTQLIVHSGAKGTIVSRGIDQPEALAQTGNLANSLHALFLDFEVEGASLVLRARITKLESTLPIVYARTLSTATSSPALLRDAEHLKSGSEARQEYLDALNNRGLLLVPVRFAVRSYAQSDRSSVAATPFIWLQAGAELSPSQARAWTASVSAGATWMPQIHTGWLLQGRVGRLLTGNVTSLTQPDLYGYVGASIITINGPGALIFQNKIPNAQDLLAAATQLAISPQTTFGAFQLGLELRVKNRIGAGFYLESAPNLNDSPNVGKYLDFGIIQFHDFGAEVTFCF